MRPLIDDVRVYGLEESITAAKYPMSTEVDLLSSEVTHGVVKLATCPKGTGHDQFLTGITVQFDLTCTNKMWVEAERYNYLEFVSSQSTMHRIIKMDLDKDGTFSQYTDKRIISILKEEVELYKNMETVGVSDSALKEQYLRILYSCPAGLRLTARMTTNYRQLKTIYAQRKNHRLPEWREFCEWITTLQNSEWITGGI